MYINLTDGSAQVVRGGEVFLVCATGEAEAFTDDALALMTSVGSASRDAIGNLLRAGGGAASGAASYARAFLPRLADAAYSQLLTGQVQSARTTIDGRYEFQNVPPGKYFVVARYKRQDIDLLWRVPISISADIQTSDLSNFNASDLRDLLGLAMAEDVDRQFENVSAMYSGAQRLEATRGRLDAARQGASEPIPGAFSVRVPC